jgi:outer membrane protein insertion porin family
VYSVRRARQDLDAVYSTGIFEDVSLVPSASPDEPGKLDLVVNVVERRTGGFSAGGGMSARGLAEGALSGVVGSCAYTQKNLFGLNQKLTASVELGQVDSLYRFSHVDPWVRSDPHRTSRVISVQNTRSNGNAIHGRGPEPPTPEQAAVAAGRHAAGAEVVVQRLMASCEYSRPMSRNWTGTAGVMWQRSGLRDETGQQIILDAYGKHLTFSTTAQQDVMALGLVCACVLPPPLLSPAHLLTPHYALPAAAPPGVHRRGRLHAGALRRAGASQRIAGRSCLIAPTH